MENIDSIAMTHYAENSHAQDFRPQRYRLSAPEDRPEMKQGFQTWPVARGLQGYAPEGRRKHALNFLSVPSLLWFVVVYIWSDNMPRSGVIHNEKARSTTLHCQTHFPTACDDTEEEKPSPATT